MSGNIWFDDMPLDISALRTCQAGTHVDATLEHESLIFLDELRAGKDHED